MGGQILKSSKQEIDNLLKGRRKFLTKTIIKNDDGSLTMPDLSIYRGNLNESREKVGEGRIERENYF